MRTDRGLPRPERLRGGGGQQTRQIGGTWRRPRRTVTIWVRRDEFIRRLVRASQLPSFDEWLSIARTGLQEPLLWESVVSIEMRPSKTSGILTVGSEEP